MRESIDLTTLSEVLYSIRLSYYLSTPLDFTDSFPVFAEPTRRYGISIKLNDSTVSWKWNRSTNIMQYRIICNNSLVPKNILIIEKSLKGLIQYGILYELSSNVLSKRHYNNNFINEDAINNEIIQNNKMSDFDLLVHSQLSGSQPIESIQVQTYRIGDPSLIRITKTPIVQVVYIHRKGVGSDWRLANPSSEIIITIDTYTKFMKMIEIEFRNTSHMYFTKMESVLYKTKQLIYKASILFSILSGFILIFTFLSIIGIRDADDGFSYETIALFRYAFWGLLASVGLFYVSGGVIGFEENQDNENSTGNKKIYYIRNKYSYPRGMIG